jgi:hypothetical protein
MILIWCPMIGDSAPLLPSHSPTHLNPATAQTHVCNRAPSHGRLERQTATCGHSPPGRPQRDLLPPVPGYWCCLALLLAAHVFMAMAARSAVRVVQAALRAQDHKQLPSGGCVGGCLGTLVNGLYRQSTGTSPVAPKCLVM